MKFGSHSGFNLPQLQSKTPQEKYHKNAQIGFNKAKAMILKRNIKQNNQNVGKDIMLPQIKSLSNIPQNQKRSVANFTTELNSEESQLQNSRYQENTTLLRSLDDYLHRSEVSLNLVNSIKIMEIQQSKQQIQQLQQNENNNEPFKCISLDQACSQTINNSSVQDNSIASNQNVFTLTNPQETYSKTMKKCLSFCNLDKLDSGVAMMASFRAEQKEQSLKFQKEFSQNFKGTFDVIAEEQQQQQLKQMKENQQQNQQDEFLNKSNQPYSEQDVKSPKAQSNISQENNYTQSKQVDTLSKFSPASNYQNLPKYENQTFKLDELIEYVQNANNESPSQQFSQILKKSFDDDAQIGDNKDKQQDIYRKFQVKSQIRPDDMVYNVKQWLRLQKIREKKILQKLITPDEMMDYIKKKNQIQILLESSKKIKNLKSVATLIEKEIETQNDRINQIINKLLNKFNEDNQTINQQYTQKYFIQFF